MAKSNGFFSLRRGSTKSLTFSVLDGKQITKDRVSEVRNPRSKQQMIQRLILKTVSLGYSSMKSIVDHSFEGITYGAASMRKFSSDNAPLVRAATVAETKTFGFANFKKSETLMGQFKISEGSLNAPNVAVIVPTFAASALNIAFGGSAATVQELANNLSVNLGDIVTMCFLAQSPQGNARFGWVRLILPVADASLTKEAVQIESNLNFSYEVSSGLQVSVRFDAIDGINDSSAGLYGVIRSQKASAGFKRSTAFLRSVIGDVNYIYDFDTALASYPVGNSYILNGGDAGLEESELPPAPSSYVVTVNNNSMSELSINGGGSYVEGSSVTLTATKKVTEEGDITWTGVPDGKGGTKSVDGLTCTFTMPSNPVSINVSFAQSPIV